MIREKALEIAIYNSRRKTIVLNFVQCRHRSNDIVVTEHKVSTHSERRIMKKKILGHMHFSRFHAPDSHMIYQGLYSPCILRRRKFRREFV